MAFGVVELAVDGAFNLLGSCVPRNRYKAWSTSERPWRRSATASSIESRWARQSVKTLSSGTYRERDPRSVGSIISTCFACRKKPESGAWPVFFPEISSRCLRLYVLPNGAHKRFGRHRINLTQSNHKNNAKWKTIESPDNPYVSALFSGFNFTL